MFSDRAPAKVTDAIGRVASEGSGRCGRQLRDRAALPLVAVIFVLSGFAALVYQVAWQRALAAIYGVNMESVTVVVTAFMLGLGLGSLAGGWLADLRRIDHLWAFAGIEAAVCVYGVGSLALFRFVGQLSDGGLGVVFLSTFATVLVPTLLMGATLPLLVGHAVQRWGNVGRSLAVLYAANTFGGAVAAVVAAVLLLRFLGLQGSVVAAAAVNAAVALLGLALRAVFPPGAVSVEKPEEIRP